MYLYVTFHHYRTLSFVNTFSFGMMSLIVAFMVTYFGMVELDHPKYTITAGLTSVTVFLIGLNVQPWQTFN